MADEKPKPRYFALAHAEHPDAPGEPLNAIELWVGQQLIRLEADAKSKFAFYETTVIDEIRELLEHPLVKEIAKPKQPKEGDE